MYSYFYLTMHFKLFNLNNTNKNNKIIRNYDFKRV
jgi:hypothetical protein